jgi:hypothetical protein
LLFFAFSFFGFSETGKLFSFLSVRKKSRKKVFSLFFCNVRWRHRFYPAQDIFFAFLFFRTFWNCERFLSYLNTIQSRKMHSLALFAAQILTTRATYTAACCCFTSWYNFWKSQIIPSVCLHKTGACGLLGD